MLVDAVGACISWLGELKIASSPSQPLIWFASSIASKEEKSSASERQEEELACASPLFKAVPLAPFLGCCLVFAGFDCRRWNRKKLKCFSVEPNFSP
jgi:hypothetical protein